MPRTSAPGRNDYLLSQTSPRGKIPPGMKLTSSSSSFFSTSPPLAHRLEKTAKLSFYVAAHTQAHTYIATVSETHRQTFRITSSLLQPGEVLGFAPCVGRSGASAAAGYRRAAAGKNHFTATLLTHIKTEGRERCAVAFRVSPTLSRQSSAGCAGLRNCMQ